MYTQCPHCDAIFQVSTANLKAANGEVRCGQCLTVFNAVNHLSDEIPASIVELEQNALDDTGRDDPWADEHSVDNSPAETAIENITADDASLESNIIIEATTGTSTETADADIFSEVIAEASQHSLPTEEMDRFEEFLSTDTPASDESDTDTELSHELTEEFTEKVDEFEAASIAHHEESSTEELSTEDFNNATFDTNGLDTNAFEAVQFGDTETATADLDIEMHTDTTDEFAEFDEYIPADDELGSGKTTEVTNNLDLDTENEVIIIEDADLEPITSKAYTDKPTFPIGDNTRDSSDKAARQSVVSDDFSELEEAAAEVAAAEIQPPSRQETFHIPALIMEDLHAAKAEQLRPSNTPWVIASLLLMLTLVLQVVYFDRDKLAKDAGLRPWLIQMCQLTNCTLTQPFDIKQIDIIGREVRTHPSARKALIASTTLINNASFVQPFPLLTVVFADINGKPMAQRRFAPREYLSNTVDLDAGMTPDMPVRIELELVDPGKDAVNYEFHAELDPRNTRPLT